MGLGRPVCQEDMYEFRVKEIFAKLRADHKAEEGSKTFDAWLNDQCRGNVVAETFLADVETYMGIPEPDDDDEDEE